MAEFRQISAQEFRDTVQEGSELQWEMGNDEFRVLAKIKVNVKHRSYVEAEILQILEQGSTLNYKAGDRVEPLRIHLYVEGDNEQKTN